VHRGSVFRFCACKLKKKVKLFSESYCSGFSILVPFPSDISWLHTKVFQLINAETYQIVWRLLYSCSIKLLVTCLCDPLYFYHSLKNKKNKKIKLFNGKLMGYGTFSSGKTAYQVGNSSSFATGIDRLRDIRLGQILAGCGILRHSVMGTQFGNLRHKARLLYIMLLFPH